MTFASDWLSIISFIISIILTIALFVISHQLSNQAEKHQKQQYTVVWVNDIFYRIDNAVSEKILIEEVNKDGKVAEQTLAYISSNKRIEHLVHSILNQYAAVGRAVSSELVDFEQIYALRRDAIMDTWRFYKPYIMEVRSKNSSDAWVDFENLHTKIANHK